MSRVLSTCKKSYEGDGYEYTDYMIFAGGVSGQDALSKSEGFFSSFFFLFCCRVKKIFGKNVDFSL